MCFARYSRQDCIRIVFSRSSPVCIETPIKSISNLKAYTVPLAELIPLPAPAFLRSAEKFPAYVAPCDPPIFLTG